MNWQVDRALKWAVAVVIVLAVIALLASLAIGAISCVQSGGVYVKTLPWYTCVGGK